MPATLITLAHLLHFSPPLLRSLWTLHSAFMTPVSSAAPLLAYQLMQLEHVRNVRSVSITAHPRFHETSASIPDGTWPPAHSLQLRPRCRHSRRHLDSLDR